MAGPRWTRRLLTVIGLWWSIWSRCRVRRLDGLSVSFYRLRGRVGWCVGMGLFVGPVRGRLSGRQGGAMQCRRGVELSTRFE